MTHNTLENYYKTVFTLMYSFKLPINIEDMYPYERDVYLALIRDDQEKLREMRLREQAKKQAMQSRGMY